MIKFNKDNIFWIIILVAVFIRLYLIYYLPIWGDEAYSAWAIQQTWRSIINNSVDPVHPPGYYLYIKIWSLVSNHLFWLRLSSFFPFLINIWLIKKLIHQNDLFQKIFLTLYVFSGYFLIFDWQLRMYTPTLTLILFSLVLQRKNQPVLLYAVNIIGLFFDYAFFWYLIPYSLVVLLIEVLQKKISITTKSLLTSTVTYLIWLIFNYRLVFSGESGIGWIKPYLLYERHIPYFLGTHSYTYLSILFLFLASYGYYFFVFKKRKTENWLFALIFSSIFIYCTTLISSLSKFLIVFHIRSLEIFAFTLIILIAISLEKIFLTKKYLFFIFFAIYIANFFQTTYMHINYQKIPETKLILHFFYWKNILAPFREASATHYISMKEINYKQLATPLIAWSFFYSAEGKETLLTTKLETKIEPQKNTENCQPIAGLSILTDSYLCPKNY